MTKSCVFLLALNLASGCTSSESQPAPSAASTTPSAKASPPSALDAASAPSVAVDADAASGASDWPEFVRKDEVPVCLFENWLAWQDTDFIAQVKPNVALRAGHAINFGVFAPGCINTDCQREVMLQCWTEVEGSVITLHSKFSGFEKPGAGCTKDCVPAGAQCNTPLLPKGMYEIVYGSERYKVRLPSVVKSPCLKR